MTQIMEAFKSSISLLPWFSLRNLIEVLIIAIIVYELMLWIMNTRAWTLLKGIIVILVFTLFAALLRLDTILWILERVSTVALLALVIIFQPELRKALEQLGSQNFVSNIFTISNDKYSGIMNENSIDAIVSATFYMAKKKTGALMTIEQNESLSDIEKTGIEINGLISSGLIINIFEKNTPLHDGAVVIRGNEVAAATCYLPLSENMNISKDLGTRHRAALGVSETTDSLTIVVSEETGRVSVAREGELTRVPDQESLRRILKALVAADETAKTRASKWWRGKQKADEKVQ